MKRVSQLFPVVLFLLFACKKENIAYPVIRGFTPGKGSFNNTVSINGTHFDSSITTTSVAFNGALATVISVSDTLILAIVPQNAITGKISITINGRTVSSATDFIVLSGKWIKKSDLPASPRAVSMGFSIGNKGYLFGGADPGSTLNDFWQYDPAANSWTEKTKPGFYLEEGISMAINNKAYVGIGHTRALPDNYLNQFWEYDPVLDTWTRKADFPGEGREGGIGLSVNGKGYAGLGYSQFGEAMYDWWQYDPVTDSWTRKTDNPNPRSFDRALNYPAGFVIDNKIYVGTGAYHDIKDWWEYDAVNDTWARKADYPGSIFFAASGFAIDNKGYVAGGGIDCWEYDPGANTWTQKAFFDRRDGGAAFSIGNKGYYSTGTNGLFQKDIWEFDPNE